MHHASRNLGWNEHSSPICFATLLLAPRSRNARASLRSDPLLRTTVLSPERPHRHFKMQFAWLRGTANNVIKTAMTGAGYRSITIGFSGSLSAIPFAQA
jgi:hypothetical protein